MRAIRPNETIRIYDCYLYHESIKEIDGRCYDAEDKCWVVPLCSENVATLSLIGSTDDAELKGMLKSRRDAFVGECRHRAPRVKVKLYNHQQNAYDFALKTFEESKGVALHADMSTGKSMMTIAITGTL